MRLWRWVVGTTCVLSITSVGACGNTNFSESEGTDGGNTGDDGGTRGDSAGSTDGSTSDSPAVDGEGAPGTVAIVMGQDNPHDLVVRGGRIYWTNFSEGSGAGSVWSANTDGSDALKISDAKHANRIAVDDTQVYWTDWFDFQTSFSSVRAALLDAGSPIALTTATVAPMGIAVDDQNVYVAQFFGFAGSGAIEKYTKAGAPLGFFANAIDSPVSIATDSEGVVWTQLGTTPTTGQVVETDLDASIESIATGLTGAWDVTIAGSNAYFTEIDSPDASGATGYVQVIGRAPGSTESIAASGLVRPYFITSDANGVYWTDEGAGFANGDVRWLSFSDSLSHLFAAGQARPHGIAVDAQYIYWTSYAEGKILRAPLPH